MELDRKRIDLGSEFGSDIEDAEYQVEDLESSSYDEETDPSSSEVEIVTLN